MSKKEKSRHHKLKQKLSYEIKTLMISPLANITYLLFDVATKKCALVDSPWNINAVLETIKNRGYQLTTVLMTHTHSDHVKDLSNLFNLFAQKEKKLNIYISKKEAKFWGSEFKELAANQVYFLENNRSFNFGETKIMPIFAPGHTPGSVCFLLEKDLIVGDVLFTYGCGRVDLWGCGKCKEKNQYINEPNCGRCDKKSGDAKLLYLSLQNLKKIVADSVQVRCGHYYGRSEYVTMLKQKQNNPYLLASDFDEFYQLRAQS